MPLQMMNIADPKQYILHLPQENRPLEPDPKFEERIFQPYFEDSKRISPVRPDGIPIRGIVIHATAGGSSHGAASVISAGKASFQFLVPAEGEPGHGEFVWATTPESRIAQSIRDDKSHPDILGGATSLDTHSLSIEIVNRQDGIDTFSKEQMEQTARLIRHLWHKYPEMEVIYSHAAVDPLRRTDPGALFEWKSLEDMVINGIPSDSPDLEQPPHTITPVEDMLLSQIYPHSAATSVAAMIDQTSLSGVLSPSSITSHFKGTTAMPVTAYMVTDAANWNYERSGETLNIA